MNDEIHELFQRQAAWQKARRNLPWPEKLRMAAKMRKSVVSLRRTYTPEATSCRGGPSEGGVSGSNAVISDQ